MSERRTRVRFAPSPTGPLHIGGVRTALYNYLYARKRGGDFILRIEDTDSHRFVPGAEEYIIEALKWCGITPGEGLDESGHIAEAKSAANPHAPYRQSQRKPIYRQYAEQLVADGKAYYAFDTADELAARRAEAEAAKGTFTYDHKTRMKMRNSLTLSAEETARLLRDTTDWTIRFKMPEDTVVAMDDLIRGHIEVNTDTLDDKVLWKRADELPTYHLANIVDDHLMEITEVIRGEEWLPSLPLHYMLYKAFGWEATMPRFAHLPLLLKPDGKGKLSKRDGDKLGFPVFPLRWTAPTGEVSRGYREDGYFPEAFVNMLAFLGWNPGDEREIMSIEELTEAFSLEHVSKSGARFNVEKAHWYNREYLRAKPDAELAALYAPVLGSHGLHPSADYTTRAVSVIRDRADFVADFWKAAPYLFVAPRDFARHGIVPGPPAAQVPGGRPVAPQEPTDFLPKDVAKIWKEAGPSFMPQVSDFIAGYGGDMTAAAFGEALEGWIKGREWPLGKVMNCLRLCLTGASSGLGIAEIVTTTGTAEAVSRIAYALDTLGRQA